MKCLLHDSCERDLLNLGQSPSSMGAIQCPPSFSPEFGLEKSSVCMCCLLVGKAVGDGMSLLKVPVPFITDAVAK